ncbi:hypothetical protein ABW19_dt0200183 [Dactylella cylindrospora]|nr:hypothetical protein ABW19_dt0200183 [Dactylella cylindrospora]
MLLLRWILSILLTSHLATAAGLNPKLLDMFNDVSNGAKRARGPIRKDGKAAEDVRRPREPKYFREPGVAKAGHYDKRYFHGFVDDDERHTSLTHLIRAWLEWSQKEGIETWLAHGTLLGWWWNAHILPWDTDLDVQISEATLRTLAEKYNMTTWPYTFQSDGFKREYLLDVNPFWVSRTRGTHSNLIDARWVDKSTGLFIDITGLSELNPRARPGIISCKNLHRYHVTDIYPLREIEFEEYKAYIPNLYDRVLVKEYRSKALTVTDFEG